MTSCQVTLKQLPRIDQIPLGVGLGLRNGRKGFVQHGHDPLLFGEGWNGTGINNSAKFACERVIAVPPTILFTR
jgi:hypothetical protein